MTCRDCKQHIRGGNTLAIKYGVRHYLHGECAIQRGADFLRTLNTWQLESLPVFSLKAAGLLHEVEIEIIERRGRGHISIVEV